MTVLPRYVRRVLITCLVTNCVLLNGIASAVVHIERAEVAGGSNVKLLQREGKKLEVDRNQIGSDDAPVVVKETSNDGSTKQHEEATTFFEEKEADEAKHQTNESKSTESKHQTNESKSTESKSAKTVAKTTTGSSEQKDRNQQQVATSDLNTLYEDMESFGSHLSSFVEMQTAMGGVPLVLHTRIFYCNNPLNIGQCYQNAYERDELCPSNLDSQFVLKTERKGCRNQDEKGFTHWSILSEEGSNKDKIHCSVRTTLYSKDMWGGGRLGHLNTIPYGLVDVEEGTAVLEDWRNVPRGREKIKYFLSFEPIDKWGPVVYKIRLVCANDNICAHDNHFVYIEDSESDSQIAKLTPQQSMGSVFVLLGTETQYGGVTGLDGLLQDFDKKEDCGRKITVSNELAMNAYTQTQAEKNASANNDSIDLTTHEIVGNDYSEQELILFALACALVLILLCLVCAPNGRKRE